MTIKRALIAIESMGSEAFFETEVVLQSGEQVGPALVIEVQDFDQAVEIVGTLSRSQAQRRRERKPAEPTPATEPVQAQPTNGARRKQKPDPSQEDEGGDPYGREKAAAAAIEDDRPF